MSKLAPENKFIDLSDYGRFLAKPFAKLLLNTPVTPIHITLLFFVVGLAAIYCIIQQYFILALFLLILKSIIDAADGELARLRQKPSYIGRFLDSNLDLVLNFGFLYAIHIVTENAIVLMLIAFIAIQLQGTVFNYYYTILRNNSEGGDTTSRIKESSFPIALHGENQQLVNILFICYTLFYGGFDKVIYVMDSKAKNSSSFPNWFMTFVSIYGLGFQLLLIGLMLALGFINFITEFIIIYSIFIFILIGIRKIVLPQKKSSQ
jgi:phosphatidylglycerophosphate synthase